MVATLRPLTYDDLQEMPDDGFRYEIIDGELIVNPAPTGGHQRIFLRLGRLLDDYAREFQAGDVFLAPFDVQFSRFDAVQPDIVFISAAHPRVSNEDNSIDFTPELVVEIISPSSRRNDRIRKMALYARSGVPEYWIVDPERRLFSIHALAGDHYLEVEPDAEGGLSSRVLPGLRIDPAAVFAVLD
jgi:Uma2 family endonuclease